MKRSHLIGTLSAVLFTSITAPANAALIGIMPATTGGTDYQAYYDDSADITWTADANLAATETFFAGGFGPGGTGTYSVMTSWIDAMNNADGGTGYLGATEWRFPFTPQTDTNCASQITSPYLASYGAGCTGGELAHLYNDYGITTTNEGPFSNIENDTEDTSGYYSSEISDAYNVSYIYRLGSGELYPITQTNAGFSYTWAVHDGDISLLSNVPIPAAAWLFGSGLLGLFGMARRKKAA